MSVLLVHVSALAALSIGLACSRTADGARTGLPGRPTAAALASGDSLTARADRARVQGDSAARVWVVIVSDFQCPYCRIWHDESYPALLREYVATGKVRMAYLNYPLPMHANARPAAEAAMCAGAQGRFWEMQDAVFGAQDRWAALPAPGPALDSLATTTGIDMGAWRKCVATHALAPLIDADRDRSTAAGVGSTPTFLIGDTRLAGALPLPEFRHAIDAALAKAETAVGR